MLPEEIKKPVKQPMESHIPYQDAYSLFEDRNFGFFLRGDCTEFVFPVVVTIRKYNLPPDSSVVGLNTESKQLYLYSPSSDGGKGQVSDKLDDSEISWMTEFLNWNGQKFDENMWALPQKEFYILETLCQERHKTTRKTITKEMSPYTPTNELLRVMEAMRNITGL